jgi:hypothetical protein
MPPLDPSLVPLVLNIALGGAALALVLLGVEYRASRWAQWINVACGLGLLLIAPIAFASAGWELAVPAALLGGAAIIAAVLRLDLVRQAILWLLRPGLVWCFLLAISAAGALSITFRSDPQFGDDEFPMPAAATFHFLDGIVAVTDSGRELSLCAYDESASLLEEERGILGLSQYQHQLIRLAAPQTECNCHGWIYTGGQYAIRSRDVDAILADNGYLVVPQPEAGDLAIYRTPTDEIAHTALVRLVSNDGSIFVESKWGPLGVYLHPVAAQPYGNRHAFYRSSRAGHAVAVLPTSSAPATGATLARTDALLPGAPSSVLSESVLSGSGGRPGQREIYERPIVRVPGQRKT